MLGWWTLSVLLCQCLLTVATARNWDQRGSGGRRKEAHTASLPLFPRSSGWDPGVTPPVLPSPLLASSQIPDSSPFQCPRGPNFQKGEGRKERRGGEEGLIREWRV